jgi:hypothetical protein
MSITIFFACAIYIGKSIQMRKYCHTCEEDGESYLPQQKREAISVESEGDKRKELKGNPVTHITVNNKKRSKNDSRSYFPSP